MSQVRRPSAHAPLSLVGILLLLTLSLLGIAGCGTTTVAKATALPTATKTPIQVSVDRTRYNIAQAIGVTVKNTSDTAYFATDTSFACTIVMLERYDTKTHKWVDLNQCGPGHAKQSYSLPKGIVEPFTLAPQSAANANTWQTGTYRVGVRYSTANDGVTKATYAYSAGFSIT